MMVRENGRHRIIIPGVRWPGIRWFHTEGIWRTLDAVWGDLE